MSQPRRRGLPTPLLLLYLLIRLLIPPSLVQAQYFQPKHGNIRRHERDFASLPNSLQRRDGDSQTSMSKDLYLVSFDDMCLFGPPDPFAHVSETNGNVVAWCTKYGRNGRLIPDGTLHGVTYVKTPNYVQVSGFGDFTKINIAPGDWGGQFDSKDHTPDGAQMFTSDSDTADNWVLIISADTYCLRACTGDAQFCPTNYDAMGCYFYTGNALGQDGQWQNCQADDGDPPGVVSGSTYTQGASPTPSPTAPPLSNCQPGDSVSNGETMPPYYDWQGSGVAVVATAIPSDQGGGDDSVSWVPVQTCTPCSGGGAPSSTTGGQPSMTSSSTGDNTQNQGVTQIKSAPPPAGSNSGSGGGSALAEAPPPDVQLHRRQDDVTTSGDQCCFTTWTSTIVGAGPQTTSAGSAGGSVGSAGSAIATGLSGAQASSSSGAGGLLLTGVSAASGSVKPTGSLTGSLKASSSLTSGSNSTNVTAAGGNGSAMGLRSQLVGVEGYGRLALSIGVGLGLVSLLGGALLV